MSSEPPKVLLSKAEACEALGGICLKTLYNVTQPRGTLPCIRIGSRVLYSPDDLRAWKGTGLRQKARASAARDGLGCPDSVPPTTGQDQKQGG